jgi:AmmeMemoRadiSam system protein A
MSPLCSEERRALLDRARRAIIEAVQGVPAAQSPHRLDLHSPRDVTPGIFVTLYYRGHLRGCVGQIESVESLAEVVERCAVAAARDDPRFSPVSSDELSDLQIEISLLSPLQPITADAIEIGRHGLVVERGPRRGLLLPQVASERHWQQQRFVEETCVKAGLPRDAWKEPATRMFAFTTEIFSESSWQ